MSRNVGGFAPSPDSTFDTFYNKLWPLVVAYVAAHSGSGTFTAPTGTGWATVTGGVLDVASKPYGKGQATIPFASYLTEDVITITGQTALGASSSISATIYASTDDVYAQDWYEPVIRNVIAGTGFNIYVRPRVGTFSGNVLVNWAWN